MTTNSLTIRVDWIGLVEASRRQGIRARLPDLRGFGLMARFRTGSGQADTAAR
jgi:hypothetical protein